MMENLEPLTEIGRKLAGGDELVIDFTVLSMTVFVLAVLMIVETIRHKVDSFAHGTSFFPDVLDAVYRELSTLGIVEAAVFLVHHYYLGLNIQVERVFAEVHFTLFYVAIINAIQSSILYLLTTKLAERQWTYIEKMDIDHYVAIRRQYELVDKNLKKVEDSIVGVSSFNSDHGQGAAGGETVDSTTNAYWYEPASMRKKMIDFMQLIRYPVLKRKHNRLLVQIRFHELRVHFLETNGLPAKFKVSRYLKLNLNDVFTRLVHIKTYAWLSLLGGANVIYFALCMVANYTLSDRSVGWVLTGIYFGYCGLFLILSILISGKIKDIFYHIMRDESWVTREDDDDNYNNDVGNESIGRANSIISMGTSFRFRADNCVKRTQQLGYFWFGDPNFIVVAAQFMQFGYAIAFAIVLVFGSTALSSKNVSIWWGWYIMVPFICYMCFLWYWSLILPQYTQCVSLGHLIQKKNLLRAEARFKLEEETSNRQQEKDHKEAEKLIAEAEMNESKKLFTPPTRLSAKLNVSTRSMSSERLVKISEMVKKQTSNLPEEEKVAPNIDERRSRRKKSVSDGVAAMRLFSSKSLAAEEALKSDPFEDRPSVVAPSSASERPLRTERRKRTRAASAGVMQMSQMTDMARDTSSEADVKKDEKKRPSSRLAAMPSLLEDIPAMTYRKAESVGSSNTNTDESDAMSDGVPDILQTEEAKVEVLPLEERLKNMFFSEKYRSTSTVLGTMVAFYFMNIRLEMILLDSCDLKDNENTWNIASRSTAFWVEVAWFCAFMIESFIGCFLFRRRHIDPSVFIACLLDITLSGTCLALLIQSEVQRCCPCTENGKSIVSYAAASEYGDDGITCNEYVECCPKFGTRLCGGIGTIEPWTSIILLRAFRFIFGNMFVSIWRSCRASTIQQARPNTAGTNTERFERLLEGDHSHVPDQGYDILDVWISAVTKNPEIVEKHGMFSGHLLEAMLGLEPIEDDNRQEALAEDKKQEAKSETSFGKEKDTLATNVQSFIRAGKTLSTRKLHHRASSMGSNSSGTGLKEERPNNLLLDIDDTEEFAHPAAVLIRRMRRCQCKLLPLLDEWTSVDVVLTKYELVWFDATKSSGIAEERDIQVRETIKSAITATKGGKGLRLCDVAIGRIVLGRISLSDIDYIKVLQLPAIKSAVEEGGDHQDLEENRNMNTAFHREFWVTDDVNTDFESLSRKLSPGRRWERQNEDRLKLHTTSQGTLYLRFLVDLCLEETVTKEEEKPLSRREGSVLWCQSISHLIGDSQLKQKLPHFGGEQDEELLDFVEVVDMKQRKKL